MLTLVQGFIPSRCLFVDSTRLPPLLKMASNLSSFTSPLPPSTPDYNFTLAENEAQNGTGNVSTSVLNALSSVGNMVTAGNVSSVWETLTTIEGEDNNTTLSSPTLSTNNVGGFSPSSDAYSSSGVTEEELSQTDAGVGAILQVLLHAGDVTTSNPLAPTEHVAIVTSDMQYSVVTNLTNLTIDLTNATYRGLWPPGGGGPGEGGSHPPPLQLSRYSLHEGVLIGIILSLIIFFSVAGNVVVCAAILSDRNLRKTSNYFIISLAVADMLVASMVMSFAVANDILGYWVFGETFCSVWISLDIMCSTASIVNLCAISLDRYIHIRSPLHYETWVTPARTCFCISAVWILSALISFVPIHLGWHQLGITPEPTAHPPNADAHFICMMELNPWYAMVSSMVSFYMPCIVMIAIYLRLYAYARFHVESMKTQTRTPMLQNGASPKAKQSNYKVADHKAAITLGVIMGTFLFCWTPFFTINIVGAFCPVCIPTVVFQVFTWLGYFNSTLNPIIYSIFNKEFRDAFKRVLNFRRCCPRREPDFRRPIKYTETYGTVNRKSLSDHLNEVTAV